MKSRRKGEGMTTMLRKKWNTNYIPTPNLLSERCRQALNSRCHFLMTSLKINH